MAMTPNMTGMPERIRLMINRIIVAAEDTRRGAGRADAPSLKSLGGREAYGVQAGCPEMPHGAGGLRKPPHRPGQ